MLNCVPIGLNYFESEKMAEMLAGEIMMLEEPGFVIHGFAILPYHAHVVLHLPETSRLSFAKALDLAPTHGYSLPPPGAAQAAARGRILASRLV